LTTPAGKATTSEGHKITMKAEGIRVCAYCMMELPKGSVEDEKHWTDSKFRCHDD
jgi:hypothetical protein